MNNSHKRGFASLTPERRREISRMGGKALSAEKRFFSTNPGRAVEAGKKGGSARRRIDAGECST